MTSLQPAYKNLERRPAPGREIPSQGTMVYYELAEAEPSESHLHAVTIVSGWPGKNVLTKCVLLPIHR